MSTPWPSDRPTPLGLTESEYDAVMRASAPLQGHQRAGFLEALAEELRNAGELGDGRVHRVIAQVQRKFWDPPLDIGYAHAGKHAR